MRRCARRRCQRRVGGAALSGSRATFACPGGPARRCVGRRSCPATRARAPRLAAAGRRSLPGRAGCLPYCRHHRRGRGGVPGLPVAAAQASRGGSGHEPSSRTGRGRGSDPGRARNARPVWHATCEHKANGGRGARRPQPQGRSAGSVGRRAVLAYRLSCSARNATAAARSFDDLFTRLSRRTRAGPSSGRLAATCQSVLLEARSRNGR